MMVTTMYLFVVGGFALLRCCYCFEDVVSVHR